jgi:hypothetical protein
MEKIFTIKLEDKGQDFLELDVLENGVLLGYSIIFSHDRLSLLGIGGLDGKGYLTFEDIKKGKKLKKNSFIYLWNTENKKPLPWEAQTLKYKVLKIINCQVI